MAGEEYDPIKHAELIVKHHGICVLVHSDVPKCFVKEQTGESCGYCSIANANRYAVKLLEEQKEQSFKSIW